MPDGKTHDRLTLFGAALSVPAWLLMAPPAWRGDYAACAVLVVSTLFSGLMLSPDLDLDSSIYHRWGLLRFLWWPYQKLIPHRSFLSHSLLLAPLLRVIYFLAIAYIVFRAGTWVAAFVAPMNRNAMTDSAFAALVDFPKRQPRLFDAAVVGLVLGTGMHVGADALQTGLRKANPFRRGRRH